MVRNFPVVLALAVAAGSAVGDDALYERNKALTKEVRELEQRVNRLGDEVVGLGRTRDTFQTTRDLMSGSFAKGPLPKSVERPVAAFETGTERTFDTTDGTKKRDNELRWLKLRPGHTYRFAAEAKSAGVTNGLLKFGGMVNIPGADTRWPCVGLGEGAFDWQPVSFTYTLPTGGSFCLMYGVERGRGKIAFRNITVSEVVETIGVPPPKAGVVFRFDDNKSVEEWHDIANAFLTNGLTCCLAVVNNGIQPGSAAHQELLRLQKAGVEIMNHTPIHSSFTLGFSSESDLKRYADDPSVVGRNGNTLELACETVTPKCHTRGVRQPTAQSLDLIARVSEANYTKLGFGKPKTYIMPGGIDVFPTAELMYRTLSPYGYVAGDFYNRMGGYWLPESVPERRFLLAPEWGSLERFTVEEEKVRIADALAKHRMVLFISHLWSQKVPGGWAELLRRNQELAAWIKKVGVPTYTMSQVADALYGQPIDFLERNILPSLDVDIDGNGRPDGWTILSGTQVRKPGTLVRSAAGDVAEVLQLGNIGCERYAFKAKVNAAAGTTVALNVVGWSGWETPGNRGTVPVASESVTVDAPEKEITLSFAIPKRELPIIALDLKLTVSAPAKLADLTLKGVSD